MKLYKGVLTVSALVVALMSVVGGAIAAPAANENDARSNNANPNAPIITVNQDVIDKIPPNVRSPIQINDGATNTDWVCQQPYWDNSVFCNRSFTQPVQSADTVIAYDSLLVNPEGTTKSPLPKTAKAIILKKVDDGAQPDLIECAEEESMKRK